MVLRGVMAAQANGPCQLAAQVGQGCGRLVDQGGQTCPLLVLGQSPPGGFRGLRWPWHWRSSGPGNAARRAALAAVAPEASSERCRAVHGHRAGSWRFGSGHVQDVELKLRQQSCGQCQLNGRLFAGQVALALLQGDHRPAQGGHDLPVVQLAALDTQRRHLVVAPPGSPPVGRYRRPRGLGG